MKSVESGPLHKIPKPKISNTKLQTLNLHILKSDSKILHFEPKALNTKLKTPNFKFQVDPDPTSKSQTLNTKHKTSNLKSQISNFTVVHIKGAP